MAIRFLHFVTAFTIATVFALPASAIDLQVSLDTAQEIPAPNVAGSTPSGMATMSVNSITGDINVSGSYSGLTSNAAAAHLHGLAPAGATAGVLFGLNVDNATSGAITGSGNLMGSDLMGFLRGETYLNLHTGNNGPGEIRGQVVDPDVQFFHFPLDVAQEIPTPSLAGASPSGMGRVLVDSSTGEVEIFGSYSGLSSPAAAAHLHGLAPAGSNAGVLFGLTVTGGTDGTFSGTGTLSGDDLAGLLGGQTYLNLHTDMNAAGEIRGQVVPEPSSMLLGLFAVTGLGMLRKRR